MKTFSIKTLGCKSNQYESSMIINLFTKNGWSVMPFGDSIVDVVIINTCTVTDRSDKKCRNYIRQGAGFSKSGKVFVTGCMVDRDSETVSGMPEVLGVFKNSEKQDILKGINEALYNNSLPEDDNILQDPFETSEIILLERTRGFIKIQDGCDGECSYCIVPIVRGSPSSRNYDQILLHAKKLIKTGCPELVLTGITIGKYSSGNKDLADLVRGIDEIPGNFRVRISSIEPNHITDKIVDLLDIEKVCPHFHIPLQSGSDKVLNLMKRRYTSTEYLRTIERIKLKNEDASIGADIIVGFPGEEDADFNSSLKLIKDAGFSYVHQFTFSPRSGTGASMLENNCTFKEVKERAKKMRDIAGIYKQKYQDRFVGRTLSSVIEKYKNKPGYSGVSDNYIKISLNNSRLNSIHSGKIANVKLLKCDEIGCIGEIVKPV